MEQNRWPYENKMGEHTHLTCDVLVLGGGLAGCMAAIAAAEKGRSVILMEKGTVSRAGSAGTGFDHWESACTNPCCKITPRELTEAYIDEQDGYSNAIAHYIETREGYDRLLDIERFGGKIRDTEGEFAGADFRDEKTGLMFAYDYENCYTIRVWGTTFKPALYRELRRLGVRILERTEATSLLTETRNGRITGIGACGMNVQTAGFVSVSAASTVLAMSRPARVWLFDADLPGLCEFRPMNSIGSGHAMGWRAGMEFTMMEKSLRGEYSAAGRSFPAYSTGNNHNTWYGATMVDARGVEIPYLDRDGNELKDVRSRFYPAPGQKFFLKGGVIDEPKYEYRGPETMSFDELIKRGYRLPFYADLSKMPAMERKVIWGMMVGQEARTSVPVLQYYSEKGFDPEKHRLQSYGTGWQSASFLGQERQLFGAPGGIVIDWDLKTSLDGVYAAGDQLFAMDCAGAAAATGYYAGRKAADHAAEYAAEIGTERAADGSRDNDCRADRNSRVPFPAEQAAAEQARLYAPLLRENGMHWKELNAAIAKCMRNYCGEIKNDELLDQGIALLKNYEETVVPELSADNPHDLMRTHEVLDILTVAQIILEACKMRRCDAPPLFFTRSDGNDRNPAEEKAFITIRQEDGRAVKGILPQRYYGEDLDHEYEIRNRDYIEARREMEQGAGLSVQEEKTAEKQCQTGNRSAAEEDKPAGVYQTTDHSVSERTAGTAHSENIPAAFHAVQVPCSADPIVYDETLCIACNSCVRACQTEVLMPSPDKGKPPVVMYPGECMYCGACVMECPKDGAIRLQHPLMNRTRFVPVV